MSFASCFNLDQSKILSSGNKIMNLIIADIVSTFCSYSPMRHNGDLNTTPHSSVKTDQYQFYMSIYRYDVSNTRQAFLVLFYEDTPLTITERPS